MQRMHLHVISTDFNSPCLKTKYHWNSFTTPFFISSKELCKQLKENGELKKISSTTAQKYLNSELKCHECSVKPKNMGDLKRHLLSSHLSEKQEWTFFLSDTVDHYLLDQKFEVDGISCIIQPWFSIDVDCIWCDPVAASVSRNRLKHDV